MANAPVIHLGDLCDRGPDTRGVLDRLVAGRDAGEPWEFLLGNHDRMFLRFLTEGRTSDWTLRREIPWFHPGVGGVATLASYRVAAEGRPADDVLRAAREAVPKAHLDFLSTLKPFHEAGALLFVHAGIRPGVTLAKQREDDLVWIRDAFLDYDRPHPWLVVHGHTALPEPAHFGNRVDLDGGTGYGRTLIPAVFEGGKVWTLTDTGRRPLRPGLFGG